MVSNESVYTELGQNGKPTEIDSLCTSCYKQGVTKVLLTKIPLFNEIILMSFSCEFCGYSNTEVMSGTPVQTTGVKFLVTVKSIEDLNRQVVRSEDSAFGIPEIDFEAPPTRAKGVLTTMEGLLKRTHEELSAHASSLPEGQEDKEKLHSFLSKLQDCIDLKREFTFELDDATGNSFVEQYTSSDPNVVASSYKRTLEQNKLLMVENAGKDEDEDSVDDELEDTDQPKEKEDTEQPKEKEDTEQPKEKEDTEQPKEKEAPSQIGNDEVLSFPTSCPNCSRDCETNMKMVAVPFFKEVLLMATNCQVCGYRTNEVRPTKGISDKGVRYELNITSTADLTRDILKTHDATISIDELELSMGATTLGGKFTTVEGIISNVRDQIMSLCPFTDSSTGDATKLQELARLLEKIKNGEMFVKLILDDPSGNSYIQNFYAPDPDPEMLVVHYERDEEQNADLGLDFMKTEGYNDS